MLVDRRISVHLNGVELLARKLISGRVWQLIDNTARYEISLLQLNSDERLAERQRFLR
jgi:hypothetical protein